MKSLVWFSLIGWWAGTIVATIGIMFCESIILLPIGWPMLKAAPYVFLGPD